MERRRWKEEREAHSYILLWPNYSVIHASYSPIPSPNSRLKECLPNTGSKTRISLPARAPNIAGTPERTRSIRSIDQARHRTPRTRLPESSAVRRSPAEIGRLHDDAALVEIPERLDTVLDLEEAGVAASEGGGALPGGERVDGVGGAVCEAPGWRGAGGEVGEVV